MLVDQQYGNVLSLFREQLERLLDGRCLGLAVHNEVVLLRVWRVRYVLDSMSAHCCVLSSAALGNYTPTPASKMPVTVSCSLVSRSSSLAD